MFKRNIFSVPFLLLALFIFGCGESSETVLSDVSPPQEKAFNIGETSWNLSLPSGWERVDIPQGSQGVVFLARRGEVNFVLLQKSGREFATPKIIFEEARSDFEIFEVLEQTPTTWTFRAKPNSKEALKVFEQKIIPLSGTENYLHASCSYPLESPLKSDCKNLMKNLRQIQ